MAYVDPGRLQRALHLPLARVSSHPPVWVVPEGRLRHRVEAVGADLQCTCPDAGITRGGPCVHRLRVQLGRLGHPAVAALRHLVPAPAEELEVVQPGEEHGATVAAPGQPALNSEAAA